MREPAEKNINWLWIFHGFIEVLQGHFAGWLFLIYFLFTGQFAVAQDSTLNNYTGTWTDDASWTSGTNPGTTNIQEALDISLSSIMKQSYGTHEFVFGTKLGDTSRRYRWVNRY